MTKEDLIEEINRRINTLEDKLPSCESEALKNGYIGALGQLNDLKKWVENNGWVYEIG